MECAEKERLKDFLKIKGLGQTKFEAAAGLPRGYVNNIRRSITPDKLQTICQYFPDLNPVWLKTGQGEMLKTEKKEEEPRPTMNVTVDKDTLIKLMMHNIRMSEQNDELRKQVEELLQRINNLEEEVRGTKKDDAKSSPSTSANNQQEDFKVS